MAKVVNSKITDSVTQVNTSVVASTPSMAMGNLYTSMGLALSNASLNASSQQQQAGITMQASTVQGVNTLGAIGSAVLGRAAEGVIEKDTK